LRLADLKPGWRSELILHAHGGTVSEREDCLVVRTPGSPTFYWGNCLYLPAAPADADLAHWEARFQSDIGALQIESRHAAFGINAEPRAEVLPSWLAAGYEFILTAVLELCPGELLAPARAARGACVVRPFDLETELDLVVGMQCTDTDGYEPVGYELFRRRQMQGIARMAEQGQAQWFGLWCDGLPAADCGLIRSHSGAGALGRFQHVSTLPSFRRRGLCSALIHAVAAWGLANWQLERVLMCADPEDVAIGIYESLGFRRIAAEWGLQRRAPQDRRAQELQA
jgi:ribosomal protein S18 acetylase RimI-like enzyme